jgi:DNA-binding response OmpR family regulator
MSDVSPGRPVESPAQPAIGFDGFVLEPARGRLLGRDGHEVALRPKALELLIALAGSEGRPLEKAELLDRVWGRVHVTEDSLFQAVKDARRALDDREGRLLRYLPRRGRTDPWVGGRHVRLRCRDHHFKRERAGRSIHPRRAANRS